MRSAGTSAPPWLGTTSSNNDRRAIRARPRALKALNFVLDFLSYQLFCFRRRGRRPKGSAPQLHNRKFRSRPMLGGAN